MRDLNLSESGILDDSMVVSASAGSGKTFTLTVLVTADLGRGELRAYEILATTFSEAASADLRERLLRPLDLLAALDERPWRDLLPRIQEREAPAVEAMLRALPMAERLKKSSQEVAQASTWWAAAPWTASPARAAAFWRRTRREAELLQVSTIHGLALGLLRQGEGAPEAIRDASHPALLRLLRQTLREALDLPPEHPDRVPARSLLAWAEKNWESISGGHDGHRDALGHLDAEELAPRRQALIQALARSEEAFGPLRADPERAVDRSHRAAHNFKPSCLLPIPGIGPGAGADLAANLDRRLRWAEKQSLAVNGKEDLAGYYTAEFREAYATLLTVSDAWEAWMRGLLVGALRGFEAMKLEHGQATFGDLVRKALRGLERGELDPPRPKLLLVDEYQDTSRAQDAFLAALGPQRTVRVGDLKQAIYGFRGGDPELLRDHLQRAGDRAFRLPSNFRSAPPLVDLANRYVEEVWPQIDPQARDLDGRQEAIGESAIPVGLVRTQASGQGADLPALIEWIAALSREEGWTQSLGAPGKSGERRRALLLRQRTKLPALLQRLKARGVQPYVVAKEGFWDSPGVRLVMAALEAVAHPDRPLPCAALLRHVVGLSDGELWALAARRPGRPGLPGLEGLNPEDFPLHRAQAARELLEWRRASTQALAGRLLEQGALLRMLRALRIHGAMEPLRARRNLAALLAMLLDLPASPEVAFARLEEERSGGSRGDLPAAAGGADLIIQTVHASKGLEYEDVILPLLPTRPQSFRRGELRTLPNGSLALAWKLGHHEAAAYRALKSIAAERQKRDDLNLLYVACTRAKERLCLLLQEPKESKSAKGPKVPSETRTWAHWGQLLAEAHPQMQLLEAPPGVSPAPIQEAAPVPPPRMPLTEKDRAGDAAGGGEADTHAQIAPETRARARQEGEAMHAYLRDLLVRWEDPASLARCLDAAPPLPQSREHAARFLDQYEARGWRHLRRRTELPIAGAAASGAEGRADLVVWEADRIHLLDFKNSRAFGAQELEGYRAQLRRYAQALRVREGLPVEAWLVALKSGEWVRVEV